MLYMCPKPGEVRRYELTVSGQDHRANPPADKNRGLDETIMFQGELLKPGSSPAQNGPPGPGADDGSMLRLPGSGVWPHPPMQFVESGISPLFAALLLPCPGVPRHSWSQQQGQGTVRVSAATFL